MKNKKIMMYLIIIILIILILLVGYFICKKNIKKSKINNEYIPEQEISNEQLRTTIINLYFLNKETLELIPESRQIDVKELINDPYNKIIELLMRGPENNKLVKLIPENTKINKIDKKEDTIYIDFSEEFIKEQNLGKEQEMLIINSIVKTLTELNEINKVIILINGESNLAYPDNEVNFKTEFIRQ